jgi:RHH-type proline utilization regulon transcriptional repressor/proline dehydrogenase/delta 1-pyrroline-5-carboxylate dehydrogenase
MALDGAKTVAEADPEVSEAVDFARYYARALDDHRSEPDAELDTCRMEPLGVVVVAPPWNFPLSIPAGGVLAALAAGNAVILKPAPEAVLVGWHLASALWDAGVPRDLLQFVPCPDDDVGRMLITDPRVGGVILTGSAETARLFLGWRPELPLFAETSGENAIVITALADRDQAIRDLVRSAFGHNGQKCSAASLAICEAEVYDDPVFRRQLRDAAESLPVGSAWKLASRITPLTQPPGPALRRALTTLEPGEEWLLEPRPAPDNPALWSPGIKLGVAPGSFFHRTECFGPVLGLAMRAGDARRGDRPRQRHRLRPHQRHPLARRPRRSRAGSTAWRPAISTSTARSPAPSCAPTVRRVEGPSVGPGAQGGGPNHVPSSPAGTSGRSPSRPAPGRDRDGRRCAAEDALPCPARRGAIGLAPRAEVASQLERVCDATAAEGRRARCCGPPRPAMRAHGGRTSPSATIRAACSARTTCSAIGGAAACSCGSSRATRVATSPSRRSHSPR